MNRCIFCVINGLMILIKPIGCSRPMLQQNSFHDLVYANRENIHKAGDTGLNLTAADYVIQMDPWWNPAVEDQAADRAHRIGQQRPLTIYRLITRGTIEEQILELHQSKRDLADSLLEGIDGNSGLSAEELLVMLRG